MPPRRNIGPLLALLSAYVSAGCASAGHATPAGTPADPDGSTAIDGATPPPLDGDPPDGATPDSHPPVDDAAPPPPVDAAPPPPTDAGPSCDGGPARPPQPTGATIDVRPPATVASALAAAQPGDRVVLHAGTYARESINARAFTDFVFVEAAAGEVVTLPGIRFQKSDHVAFRGIRFAGTVMLDGSSYFKFDGVTLDGGSSEEAALQIHGQGAAGASHDVAVVDSKILGGGRTVFVLGAFAPSEKWNHHLTFLRNDITCGSHNCFQISGGRDMLIAGNQINGTTTAGILSAGGTRLSIARNRFRGMNGKSPVAVQLATPGAEWDDYAGVENMITSAVVVANNLVDGWGTGVQLDAARDVAIVYDTVVGGTGVRLNHRTPHDQAGKVILDGNAEVRVWNSILPSIAVSSGEARPAFESNNLVSTKPMFEAGADFVPAAGSPAIDGALVNDETPLGDFEGLLRGDRPDVGAREVGATIRVCEGAR